MADLPQKQNAYLKIYNTGGTYQGTIDGIVNDWQVIQEINSPACSLDVTLMTNPITSYENSLIVHYYKVELWVNTLTSPSGIRKYIGYIDSYDQDYDAGTMTVHLISYGVFLDTTIYESGSNTTITHTSVDLAVILKAALDNHVSQGGLITYTASTIPTTGITVTYTFNTATVLDVIKKCLEIAGDDFYWYIDMTTNYLYFKQYDFTTVSHHLKFGRSILSVRTKKGLHTAANAVFFTGGDTGGGTNLFKKYTSAANKALQGGLPIAVRKQDERVTTTATADAIANPILEVGADYSVNDDLTIAGDMYSADGYPIDTISLGQTIAITNASGRDVPRWDSAVWDVDRWDYGLADIGSRLNAVRYLEYSPDRLRIIRGRLRNNPGGITRENGEDIKKIYTKDNPVAPS